MEATDPSLLSAGLRMIWGLIVVLGIILIIYALMRKRFSFARANIDSRIKILEIRQIMPKKSICLVAVGDQEFLIGLGQDTITLLGPVNSKAESTFPETLAAVTDPNEG
jgi:flagellar protein FliO/FliZ